MTKYLKSPCCKKDVRGEVQQSARVHINERGEIETYDDLGDGQINDEELFCEACGQGVAISKWEDKARLITKN